MIFLLCKSYIVRYAHSDIIPRFVLFVKRFIKKIRFFCVFVFLIIQLSDLLDIMIF